jgi:amidase
MKRFAVVLAGSLAVVTVTTGAQSPRQIAPRLLGFNVAEATINDMQLAMRHNRVTSKEPVLQSFARIAFYKTMLNPVISLYPSAIDEAEQRDLERERGIIRGPLHGIPVAVKDNINTTFMPTTGGALAFLGYTPPYDAKLVTNLRNAGAVNQRTRLAT